MLPIVHFPQNGQTKQDQTAQTASWQSWHFTKIEASTHTWIVPSTYLVPDTWLEFWYMDEILILDMILTPG